MPSEHKLFLYKYIINNYKANKCETTKHFKVNFLSSNLFIIIFNNPRDAIINHCLLYNKLIRKGDWEWPKKALSTLNKKMTLQITSSKYLWEFLDHVLRATTEENKEEMRSLWSNNDLGFPFRQISWAPHPDLPALTFMWVINKTTSHELQ